MTTRRAGLLTLAGLVLVVLVALLVVVVVRHDREPPEAGPTPAPSSAAPTGVPATGSPAQQRALLAERVGYGAGVTGGAGGRVVRVTSDADDGPGTLREAVQGDDPKWVVFSGDASIRLDSGLAVGSNTTIDGRGRSVTLTGPGTDGLLLDGVSNVVVESLTLRDFGDTAKTEKNDMPDAIHLEGAKGVWIDHNDLSRTGDKLVAVSGGSSAVTVSWNHFHDQEQTFQIGNQATSEQSADQTVTIHHNFFDRNGYRMPVISYGRAHVFDNYYLDWRLYAVRAERRAQVYLEDNVFEAGRSKRAVVTKPGGDGCNDTLTRCDSSPGALRSVGNVVDGAKRIRESDPGSVFDPAATYRYEAEPAGSSLASSVESGAGPR
ncbi:hypothetical protein GCM10011519_22910 [Marmoricola endophyticus]|uniref:pectate lyase n=1 Tax=Marmoricola endophyticus TaxID=2040280 RepID=A0A917BMF2_9ACTN|nr:polysaccharide lyase family 1 protein [Marmoricola endophyticus]GGF48333.1 hypothetical protein GCM10011519_22910 [Marmoricola endophyticus]